jgi:3-oxoadipate enol-lactonase/4-carboxymuconolactone decarboxylase
MIPAVTGVRMSGVAHRAELPLLVLGPSLGTSAVDLWTACADLLTDSFDVLAWDLPGHGHNRSVPDEGFTMAELAQGVLALVADIQEQRGDSGTPFAYAGVSVGGTAGLCLLLDHADRVTSAALICTGGRIGDVGTWADRIGRVTTSGTAVLVSVTAERWFAHGFFEREPDRGAALLHALHVADDRGYVQVCEALAHFDVRDRLTEIGQPVLAIAGKEDMVTPPALLREIATVVRAGRLVVLEGAAHLAPAERPAEVADLLRQHFLGEADAASVSHDTGLAVRREVLGDEHVDRALSSATELTEDFQDFITTYAWGGIWSRPGLDRRSRSMITLTALVAHGHHEELALHLRAARRNGLSWGEIKEVLLQTAVYSGVPAANTAFRIAQQVRDEEEESG